MGMFYFQGVDFQGRRRSGQLGAADEDELERLLRGRGVWLLEARPDSTIGQKRNWRRRGSRRELIQFVTLMAFQTRVGIPLVQALEATAQDGESRIFARLILDLKQRVEGGMSLAESLEQFPRTFATDFVQLVRAGERGGSLPESFVQLKQHLEWQERVAAEVKQATLYPAVVLVATAALVFVLFTFVVPKFALLLTATKVPLPGPTRFVFGVSGWVRDWGGWCLAAGGFLVGILRWARGKFEAIGLRLDHCRLRLPVVGPFVRLVVLTRFAHNLALLYRNGVVLPTALGLVVGVVGSPVVAAALNDVRARVLQGSSLSEALRKHSEFPSLVVRLVVIGERTGQLDDALEHVAGYYHELLPQRLKRLLSLLEPALILGLVAVVGTVALAVILPVLSLMQSLR